MHPDIDPVAISLGPIDIHWYGLMYLVGFACGYWLGVSRAASTPRWNKEQVYFIEEFDLIIFSTD